MTIVAVTVLQVSYTAAVVWWCRRHWHRERHRSPAGGRHRADRIPAFSAFDLDPDATVPIPTPYPHVMPDRHGRAAGRGRLVP